MDLINAAEMGQIRRVRELLDSGIDPNIRRLYSFTPLINASRYGHTDIVRLLLDYGADPNRPVNQDAHIDGGLTPLFYASYGGNTEIVKILLDAGADPNIKGDKFAYSGKTPLLWASWRGDSDMAESLLQHGADPNIRDSENNTALMIAEYRGYDDIVRLIRDHIDIQRSLQNVAFMKYFLNSDDLDIDTASRIFDNERSYNPGVSRRSKDEYRRDPLIKSKQRLRTMRGIHDNESVLQYLSDPEIMRNVDSYLTSMRPYPSVHSRMMLEDKKGGKKRRKNYTRMKNYTHMRY